MAVEKELEEQETPRSASEPLEASSTPLAQSGGASGGAGTPASAATASPSGRPNIKQYLQANQGAGQSLASGIQQRYGQDAEQFKQKVGDAETEFNKSTDPLNKKLGEEGDSTIKTSFQDPSKLLNQQGLLDQNNAQAQEFTKLRTGGYQQDIDNVAGQFGQQKAQLQNQLGNLNQQADFAKSDQGRFQLLKQAFGSPTYSRGQQKLDQLFLQAQPGVSQQLHKNLLNPFNQAKTAFNETAATADNRIKALSDLTTDRKNQVKNTLAYGNTYDGDVNTFDADLAARGFQDISESSNTALEAAKARAAAAAGIQDRLISNQVTDADREVMGVTPGTALYDVNLNDYLGETDMNPTLTNAASPEEFARYRALQQLAGDTSNDLFGGATEAGGYKPFTYRTEDLTKGIDARRQYHEETRAKQVANELIGAALTQTNFAHLLQDGQTMTALRNVKNMDDINAILSSANYAGAGGATGEGAMRDYVNSVLKQRNRKI